MKTEKLSLFFSHGKSCECLILPRQNQVHVWMLITLTAALMAVVSVLALLELSVTVTSSALLLTTVAQTSRTSVNKVC